MSGKLFFIVFALVVSFVLASPTKKSNYIEQENSCREVCGLCDCDGFYCEDECICECSLENEENLQCIADMKTECDANGLEYELMMEESTKQRFMREIQDNSINMDKHLFVMKQKRQSNSSEPIVGAAAPTAAAEPIVAAPAPSSEQVASAAPADSQDSNLGNTNLALSGVSTIGALNSIASLRASTGLKGLSGVGVLPTLPALPAIPALPASPARTAALRSLDFSKLSIVLRDQITATKARIAALPALATSSALTPAIAPAAAVVAPAAAATAARSALLARLSALKIAPAAVSPAASVIAPAAAAATSARIAGLGSLPSLASLTAFKGVH